MTPAVTRSRFSLSPKRDADAAKRLYFPNQGGLPIKVDGQTIGAMAASGAKSEIDEAIAQAGIDALLKP